VTLQPIAGATGEAAITVGVDNDTRWVSFVASSRSPQQQAFVAMSVAGLACSGMPQWDTSGDGAVDVQCAPAARASPLQTQGTRVYAIHAAATRPPTTRVTLSRKPTPDMNTRPRSGSTARV
jgi:hypothetical protein